MKMTSNNCEIYFDDTNNNLFFIGVLRSNDFEEFEKIKNFILDTYDLETSELILNFSKLEFMNSAGISTLCRFVLEAKEMTDPKPIKIIGNKEILWQVKSFENLKKYGII